MKTIIVVLGIVFILCSNVYAGDWSKNWTINGIPVERFKHAEPEEYLEMAVGMGTSMLVHWGSHVLWLELNGKDWHQSGLKEICESSLTNSEARMFGRAGFVGSLVVGTGLKFTPLNDTWFATGYHSMTFLEISLYPALHHGEGDLHLIEERGGNDDLEYVIYTGWSAALLLTK